MREGNEASAVSGEPESPWSALEAAVDAAWLAVVDAERRTRHETAAAAAKARLLQLQLAHHGPNDNLSTKQIATVREYLRNCVDTMKQLATEHRNIHIFISRVGRSIDRNFVSDILPAAPQNRTFSSPERQTLMNEAILLHLYREGLSDIAEIFSKEACIRTSEKAHSLLEFHDVVTELKRRNPQPALTWLYKYGDIQKYSELAFKLHRLVFRNISSEGHMEAIKYAQEHFPQFAKQHKHDLQKTMCLLVYESSLLPISYVALSNEIIWYDGLQTLLRDASEILNIPSTSPIESVINIGATAVPTLLDIHDKLVQIQRNQTWYTREELPIEMSKGYHSVFSCPILRQQSNNDNPPMRLLCGHVITRNALESLSSNYRIKCPYCPTDQKRSDIKVIYL